VSSNMSDSTSFSDLLRVLDVNPAMLTDRTHTQPLILLSTLQTSPSLRNSEQEKDRSDISVPKKLDMRKTGFGKIVRNKKNNSEHQLRNLTPRTLRAKRKLYLNLLRNMRRIRGTTMVLTWCLEKLLSEASSVRRGVLPGSTHDNTSRRAQLEHRSSPKRPKVVHPPASVELASSKWSETGNFRIPFKPVQNPPTSRRVIYSGHRPVMSYGEAPRRDRSYERRYDSHSRYGGARWHEFHRHQADCRPYRSGRITQK